MPSPVPASAVARSVIAALAFLMSAACAGAPQQNLESAQRGDVAAGRRIAETHCSTCHAIGESGESRHPMAPPLRTLSRNYPVNMLEEAFAEGILVGHRDMPEFRLEPEEIDDLLAYLNSIQERRIG